jgi:hypothetical protein
MRIQTDIKEGSHQTEHQEYHQGKGNGREEGMVMAKVKVDIRGGNVI